MAESSRLGTISSLILTVCAVLVTAAVVRREFFAPVPSAPQDRELAGASAGFCEGTVMGPVDAAVSLLVFSDFQCPFCVVLHRNLQIVRARYPGAVRVVFRHIPIESLHPYAYDAALAAECAGAQGRFEAFHDALFDSQDSIPREQWSWFADGASVADIPRFDQCMQTRQFEDRVRADMEQAKRFRLTGTPSVIVGETLLGGTPSARVLDSLVRAALPSSALEAGVSATP